MKIWQVGLGLALAAGIGAAVFLGTRKASAAASGKKAFRVDAGCTKVETIDQDAAKSAVQAAAMAEFRGKDEPAIDYLGRVIVIVIGCTPSDATMFVGLPGSAGGLSWGSIRSMVGNRTVAELAELAASGGFQMAMAPGKQGGALPSKSIEDLARWLMPSGWFDALRKLATEVPVPVPASKYPEAQAPASGWSRLYEWGNGLYVIRETPRGYSAHVYNLAYYPDRLDLWDVGVSSKDTDMIVGKDESAALWLAYLDFSGDTGSQF